ncbi:MAG: peptide ligase PGM1-related protein, partial [Acidobacteriota bacterium]
WPPPGVIVTTMTDISTHPVRFQEEQEIEAFELLKPQLGRLWDTIFPGDRDAYTSVIVPSLSLDQGGMAKIAGISFYEERLLFLLMRLRNPLARLIYVTSQPIHPVVLDYYLQLLVGIPGSHARARLTLLCVHDSSPRSLTEKILERPRLMNRIAAAIGDPSRAYLTVFNATPLERTLSVRLGVPMNATDPRLTFWGSKSGSRQLFREAGVDFPYGHENLHTRDEIEDALFDIAERRPGVRSAMLKLNEGFSGEGNARFTFPQPLTRSAIRDALADLQFSVPTETTGAYLVKFAQGGGIVEEMIVARMVTSPSVQVRINPRGDAILSSTHEQILGGEAVLVYLGCLFPAADDYRDAIQELGLRIGRGLADKGVIGRFSVDFLAWRDSAGEPWHITALEVNLRMGGTTHPMLALRFLTGGELDPRSGLLYAADGRAKYYRASDNVQSESYRGLLPEDLIDILVMHRLDFSHRTATGVLFHMIGSLSQFGKFGMTAIGNSREEADYLFDRTVDVLNKETCR